MQSLDVGVSTKRPDGCGERSGKVVKLERAFYEVKQAGRQWLALLCKTIVGKVSMEQCRPDPYVFQKKENKKVLWILVVHVDDLLAYGNETVCEELLGVRSRQFSTPNLRELEWYLGCAAERDWQTGTIKISQSAIIETLLTRFDMKYFSSIPASDIAEIRPTTDADVVTGHPFRQTVGDVMRLASITRLLIADSARAVARHPYNPCEMQWVTVRIIPRLHQRRAGSGHHV